MSVHLSNKSDLGLQSDSFLDDDYFSPENLPSDTELRNLVVAFSNSYSDHGSVDAFAKRIPPILAAVPVLHDVKPHDKQDDIGHKLYLNIGTLLRSVDKQIFPPLIATNTDLIGWISDCRETRSKLLQDKNSAQILVDETLLCPDSKIYDLRATTDYYETSETLRENFAALSATEQDQSVPLTDQLKVAKAAIAARHNRIFLQDYDTYQAKLTAKNAAHVTLREKEQELKRLYTFESVLEAFLAAERQIVSLIQKAVVTHCVSLKSILQGTAHLPFNGKEISNPWDSQNLSGLACLVHERFHKRSFVTFNNHLLDAMGFNLSEADTRQAHMKAVTAVQQMIFHWDSRNLWTQMSPDYFWTAVLLRSLQPNVPIRQDLLNEVQKFLRQQQSTGADQKPSLNTPTLPLFNCACTYLTSIHDSKKFLSNSRTHTSAPPTSSVPPTLPYSGHRGKYTGLEQAAAASLSSHSTATTPVLANASSPVSPVPSGRSPPNNPYQQDGKTIYTKAIRALAAPVHRTANVYFQHHHNGPIKRYLAVQTVHDICSNCFPSDAATPAPHPCQPSCTSRLCTRCNYYGHNGAWCLQTHTTSGVVTPQFSASSGVPKN
jgi:hypothetical protein